MSTSHTNQRRPVRAGSVAKYVALSLIAIVMTSPLLFGLYVSFLSPSAYLELVPPTRWTLDNYFYVMQNAPIGKWYLNTLVVTGAVLLGALVVNTMAGYALARLHFTGRKAVFFLVIGVLMVPLQAYLIPLYLQVASYGWLNTLVALIVPFMVNPMLIFLMRQTFKELPSELDDAATVDGAGKFRVFFQIGLPLAMTGIATQAILAGTWTWNSFMIPATMNNDPDVFVLTVGLNSLQSTNYVLPTVQMAGVVLLTIPIVIMFVVFQRWIVPSLASSGIKG